MIEQEQDAASSSASASPFILPYHHHTSDAISAPIEDAAISTLTSTWDHSQYHTSPSPPRSHRPSSRRPSSHRCSQDHHRQVPDLRYHQRHQYEQDHVARPAHALVRPPSSRISHHEHLSPDLGGASSYSRRASQAQSLPYYHGPIGGTSVVSAPPSCGAASARRLSQPVEPRPFSSDSVLSSGRTTYPLVEKAYAQSKTSSAVQSLHSSTHPDSSSGDEVGEGRPTTVKETIRSLLHLSFTALPLSLALLFYTIFVLLYTVLTSPLRLCIKSRPSLRSQLCMSLIPALNLQYRCVHLPPITAPSNRTSTSPNSPLTSTDGLPTGSHAYENGSPGPLILVHLLAPIIALPLSFCAMIMGFVWALGGIVSDEEAGDSRDERCLAENVVGWWTSWLSRGRAAIATHAVYQQQHSDRPQMRQISSQHSVDAGV